MKFQRKTRKNLSLDMTPLIDVIFLLLIFFMISTTFIETDEINVLLPEVSTKSVQKIESPLEITIDSKNQIYLGTRLIPMDQVRNEVITLSKKSMNTSAIIRADGEVKHKIVVHIMDILKQTGFKKLSVATLIKPSP